tara:strand:- start:1430 stop:1828 length:399 start_codon:yes stop_codon:yes gene_type:complete
MTKIIWPDGRIEIREELNDEEFAARQCEVFYRMLNEYSDDLPAEVVHSTSKDNKYKCRAALWGILNMRMGELEKRGLLPTEISSEYHTIMQDYETHLKQRAGLTSAEDISAASSLLRKTISCLDERLGPSSN